VFWLENKKPHLGLALVRASRRGVTSGTHTPQGAVLHKGYPFRLLGGFRLIGGGSSVKRIGQNPAGFRQCLKNDVGLLGVHGFSCE
jgi:hypothetical protein